MLESIEKFFRQNWKVIISLLLALTALALVIAFPSSVVFLGDLVLFGGTPFEFLSLMMLSEVPFFMWLASFFASIGTFIAVLTASALFNYATKIYNYCFEKIKYFWHKHPTVVVLLAALVLVATIALMVVTQSWVVPVAIVVFHIVSQLIKWADSKINPKCDLIRLPSEEDPTKSNVISAKIQKQMRCGRSLFLYNKTENGKVTEYIYEAKRTAESGSLIYEPIELKESHASDTDALQSRAELIGMFPKSKDSPRKVVSALERGIKSIKDWRKGDEPKKVIVSPELTGTKPPGGEGKSESKLDKGLSSRSLAISLSPLVLPSSGENIALSPLEGSSGTSTPVPREAASTDVVINMLSPTLKAPSSRLSMFSDTPGASSDTSSQGQTSGYVPQSS